MAALVGANDISIVDDPGEAYVFVPGLVNPAPALGEVPVAALTAAFAGIGAVVQRRRRKSETRLRSA
jgi:hypothetical protein